MPRSRGSPRAGWRCGPRSHSVKRFGERWTAASSRSGKSSRGGTPSSAPRGRARRGPRQRRRVGRQARDARGEASRDRPEHLAGGAGRLPRCLPGAGGRTRREDPAARPPASRRPPQARRRDGGAPARGRRPPHGPDRASLGRGALSGRRARQHAVARPLGRDPARADPRVRRDGGGRRLLVPDGQARRPPRRGRPPSRREERRDRLEGALRRVRACRAGRGRGGARCGARRVLAQGPGARPGARAQELLGTRHAVARLHVHVPPRRRLPRGRRRAGRGAVQLRIRARGPPHGRRARSL